MDDEGNYTISMDTHDGARRERCKRETQNKKKKNHTPVYRRVVTLSRTTRNAAPVNTLPLISPKYTKNPSSFFHPSSPFHPSCPPPHFPPQPPFPTNIPSPSFRQDLHNDNDNTHTHTQCFLIQHPPLQTQPPQPKLSISLRRASLPSSAPPDPPPAILKPQSPRVSPSTTHLPVFPPPYPLPPPPGSSSRSPPTAANLCSLSIPTPMPSTLSPSNPPPTNKPSPQNVPAVSNGPDLSRPPRRACRPTPSASWMRTPPIACSPRRGGGDRVRWC